MKRRFALLLAVALLFALPLLLIPSPVYARVSAVAAVCLFLWISEIVPPFVPTLLLWALVPLLLGPVDPKYGLGNVMGWAADPVLALFFGGFVLGIATESHGLDKRLTRFALRSAGTSFHLFLLTLMALAAVLSMWMSNIAAAALVFASVRSTLGELSEDNLLRRTALIGVALGADLGGIATPIGTGPNAIAIGAISADQSISFLEWMVFGLPLSAGMLLLAYFLLLRRTAHSKDEWQIHVDSSVSLYDRPSKLSRGESIFLFILAVTVLLWLTEPLHRIPSAVVALAAAATLFFTGMLKKRDIARIDWSTLLLIAGGITLGRLLEQTGVVHVLASAIPFSGLHISLSLFLMCLASAVLSALMSNTATAVMIIPIATALVPFPSTAILIAISASFGLPFVISTPQNAMAFGEGGPRFGDLFRPGIIIMIVGCLIVSFTGRWVLNFVGIP